MLLKQRMLRGRDHAVVHTKARNADESWREVDGRGAQTEIGLTGANPVSDLAGIALQQIDRNARIFLSEPPKDYRQGVARMHVCRRNGDPSLGGITAIRQYLL